MNVRTPSQIAIDIPHPVLREQEANAK